MDKYVLVGIVFVLCIVLVVYTQISSGSSSAKTLKQKLQTEFPKFKIIEKSDTLMICEINHRNEPEELVIIRVDSNQKKIFVLLGDEQRLPIPSNPQSKK